tara:strand:+ start:2534 stop:3457 length:924 start_codon:yes stop_codon:yes gene_type:complete
MRLIKDILKEELLELESNIYNNSKSCDIQTGFTIFDNLVGGFKNGELIVMGGRPAMGTFPLMVKMAYQQAVENKKVVIYSFFEDSQYIIKLLVSIITNIDFKALMNCNVTEEEQLKVKKAFIEIHKLPIFINDNYYLDVPSPINTEAYNSIETIIADLKLLNKKEDIDMVYIDNLDFLSSSKYHVFPFREVELGIIFRQLRGLAKHINTPVYINFSLSNRVEKRGGEKRPWYHDLRNEEQIIFGEYADLLLFLWRAEYYGIVEDEDGYSLQERGDVIVASNRRGFVGDVSLKFSNKTFNFSNLLEAD